MRPDCWFARLDGAGPCWGQMDKAHVIPKSLIKKEIRASTPEIMQEIVWHPSVWVWGCRRHHGNFDARHLRITREQVPEVTERYAEVFGFGHILDRMYGERVCPVVGVTTDHEGGEW